MKNKQDYLTETISLLEKKQKLEFQLLKEQMHDVYESIKPANIIKNTFHQITSSPNIKNDIVGSIIGLASGYVSKKLFVAGSHNPITNILGTLLQMGVTNVASKKSEVIKSFGEDILQFVINKFKKEESENPIDYNIQHKN